MADATGSAAKVRVQFSTRSPDLELPQDIGSILVSTDFRRLQLQTLVNNLLQTEEKVSLEFLINNQLIKSSLDEYLAQNAVSAETTLQIEYIKAQLPPEYVASYPHDDWVSAVDVLSATSRAGKWSTSLEPASERILSASYDGTLRVWNMSSEVVATVKAHGSAVKSAKFVSSEQVLSAGTDGSIRMWNLQDSQLTPKFVLLGHKSQIENLAIHTPSSRILSASHDHTVGIWSVKKGEGPSLPQATSTVSNKRRKLTEPNSIPRRGPLGILKGHQSQVADVCFDEKDSTVGYSVSWDHSLKTWDLTTGACVDTRTTAQSLFSVCHLPSLTLLATGTSARHITLIDPRASAVAVSVMTLRGHKNAVVSLARDPDSDHRLVSASHDGTCRVWDVRAVQVEAGTERIGSSVFKLERDGIRGKDEPVAGDGIKVFDVCWDHDVGIVSGGEDKTVQIEKNIYTK